MKINFSDTPNPPDENPLRMDTEYLLANSVEDLLKATSSRQLTHIASLEPAVLDHLVKAYAFFMNKSDVFILTDSKIINHRIPSKGDRLLLINLDLSNYIKDKKNKALLSLQLVGCKERVKYLKKLHSEIAISLDVNQGIYCFSNDFMDISVPQLNQNEIDNYSYDIDIHDEKHIYMFDMADDYIAEVIAILHKEAQTQIMEPGVLRLFDKTAPVDILISNNCIIGFQQHANIISTDMGRRALRTEAEIILRSYNFYHFDPKNLLGTGITQVIRNYDNEFWLLIEGNFCGKKDDTNLRVYENLEWLRS